MNLLVPPPLVTALAAAGAWGVDAVVEAPALPQALRLPIALGFAVCGLVLMVVALATMVRARTTFNPMKPETAARLVTHGVFGVSRNPIYLADLLFVAAFVAWFGNAAGILLLPLFVWYIGRFQIRPEEAALEARFGEDFRAYRARVRRWL